jgi:glycosyltransferase involved in cell wall biosynthesis
MDDREILPNPVCCDATGAERPLVSVIVTFFNQASFVRETIESVLSQDYSPYEIIVIDDGSTDDTPHVCASFGDQITFVRQSNAGVSAARNAGVRRARGSLLAFLDGDDLWEPGKLSAQVQAAQGHPESGVIVADGVKFFGSQILSSTLYYAPIAPHFATAGNTSLTTRCHDVLLHTNLIQTPSQAMVRASVFSHVGPWVRVRGEDHDFWLRVAAAGYSFTFLARSLTRYRYVESSSSGLAELRGFVWGLDRFTVLRLHRARVSRDTGRVIAAGMRNLTLSLAWDAYYYALRSGKRMWSLRYMLRLAKHSRRPHLVLPYLAALFVTPRVGAMVKRVVRKHGFRGKRSR